MDTLKAFNVKQRQLEAELGDCVADPFGLVRDGKLTIFCEYLDYRDGIGTIAAIQPFESPPSASAPAKPSSKAAKPQ